MMDLTPCILASSDDPPGDQPEWRVRCIGSKASSAHLIESTLQQLQPEPHENSNLQLGYTLKLPLLSLLKSERGQWVVNEQAISHVVQTIRDNPRPLVLYLFSTHFSVHAPVEPELARNPANIAHTVHGPLPLDSYYGQPVYPWSLARTDNPITRYRIEVIQSLLGRICTLPATVRGRIRGITLLGEVHQLFPKFESGMGFETDYQVGDYDTASVEGFRQYLQKSYASLQALNQQLGTDYNAFEEIVPPAKDIRREPLRRYEEHIDSFAAGSLPITGWIYSPETPSATQIVKIFLDGKPIADAPVNLSRQDVRTAHREFNTADLGWRFDLDYRQLATGIHRIDLALSQPGQPLTHIDSRTISIMDKHQTTPAIVPAVKTLPTMRPRPVYIIGFTDQPRNQTAYYYNPMASQWQTFRQLQVVNYLQYFNNVVGRSCMSGTPRYTHQILPQFNPSWDSSKFATDASLRPLNNLRSGISLYGQASYGDSFASWIKSSGHKTYGVTEFHPLQPMPPEQLDKVLEQHRANGAQFLSFFLETRWHQQTVSTMPNLFSFDPDNQQHGSNALYFSMKRLLND